MSARSGEKCEYCGASTTPRRETMCRRLCEGLIRLNAAGSGEFHPRKELQLDHVDWNVFQKLQYWRLVAKGSRRGYWTITPRGRGFVAGSIGVPKVVFVLRNKVTRVEEVTVRMTDYLPYDDPKWSMRA